MKRWMRTMMIGLAASLALPSLAMAIPTDYDVVSGGTLTIQLARRGGPITVDLGGGHFTYDADTGALSNFSLMTANGRTLTTPGTFSAPFQSTDLGGPIHMAFGSWQRTVTIDIAVTPSNLGAVGVVGPPANAVPEPTAALLFGAGVALVGTAARRREQR